MSYDHNIGMRAHLQVHKGGCIFVRTYRNPDNSVIYKVFWQNGINPEFRAEGPKAIPLLKKLWNETKNYNVKTCNIDGLRRYFE